MTASTDWSATEAPVPLSAPASRQTERAPGVHGAGAGAPETGCARPPATDWRATGTSTASTAGMASSTGAFTEDRMLRPVSPAPARGWRRLVYRGTNGLVNPGPSNAERQERELVARVRAPIAGSRRIAVISRKGGVGKTTTTLMLGHTLAFWRGDRVVAVDGNPDAGSLAYRVRRETPATLTDLLAERRAIQRYSDVRAYTSQAPTRLEVVASDDDPRIAEALTDADYAAAVDVLDRHYNLVLLDTGTGILDSGTKGVLREADQVVVVVPPALDGARVAASTLDWLGQHGYAHLVSSAVAVINGVTRRRGLVEVERVEEHFATRCAATVRLPWDGHLEAGAQVRLGEVKAATKRAYLDLAAAVADGFSTVSLRTRNEHRKEGSP